MANQSAPPGAGWPSSGRPDEDGWGPSTAVYSGSTHPAGTPRTGRAVTPPNGHAPTRHDDGWSAAGPASRAQQRANKANERRVERSIEDLRRPRATPERGLPWWAALAILIVIAAIGGIIDTLGSIDVRGGFNIGIVAASIIAVLIVKRSHMFPIVIAPPIVYSLAAVFQLYVRSGGLHDKRVVFDAAANYLVYGFPAIAAATAAVLIIAGIRMISRK